MSTSPSLNKELVAALRTIAEFPVTDMLLNMDAANMRRIAEEALASTPSALPVEGAGWMPFALTLATALDRGDEAALLMDENSPLRDELRRLIAKERAITSGSAAEVKEAERDCMFTPGHADFERRQTFTAPIVGSWPWLRGCINGIPKREEFRGGQRTRYVQLDEVLGWIDEGERRAALASPAIVGTPSKEGAGQVEAEEVSYEVWIGDECAAMATSPQEASRYAAHYSKEISDKVEVFTVYSRKVSWDATPPAPSEGGGEQIAHIKQAIYTISGGDFDATDDEARRIAEAILSLSPSRGVDAEMLEALQELWAASQGGSDAEIYARLKARRIIEARVQSQGSAK